MADPLDDLYGAPLAEFTQLRNDIVKTLKSGGKKEEAAQVTKLKRPTVPAWAVNQLARREADRVERLIEIQHSLGDAGDAKTLQRLGSERRRAVTELTEAARKILSENGQSATAATLEKISSTLLAATSEDEQDVLRRGRLERELSASGFGEAFGGLTGFEAEGGEAEEEEPEENDEDRRAELRERAERLSKEADEAEKKARSLADEVEKLEAKLADAKQKAEAQAKESEVRRAEAEEALGELGD